MQIIPVRLPTTCELILFRIYCIIRKGEYAFTEGGELTNKFRHLKRSHQNERNQGICEIQRGSDKGLRGCCSFKNGCRGGQQTIVSLIDSFNNTTDFNKIKWFEIFLYILLKYFSLLALQYLHKPQGNCNGSCTRIITFSNCRSECRKRFWILLLSNYVYYKNHLRTSMTEASIREQMCFCDGSFHFKNSFLLMQWD